jgi:hypothetical protein
MSDQRESIWRAIMNYCGHADDGTGKCDCERIMEG